MFLAVYGLMQGLGVLACYCLGTALHWRSVAALPPLLYTTLRWLGLDEGMLASDWSRSPLLSLALIFIPESPIWLLGHHGEDRARAALSWLRWMCGVWCPSLVWL